MAKIRTIMEIVFDYDPETNEYTPISQKIIGESSEKEKKTKSNKTVKSIAQNNLGIIREDGKLILSEDTVTLLGVKPDDRVFIGYDKFGSGFKPFIGTDETKGNKLTKANTVSYRGKSNDELAYYGTNFKLTPGKHPGTFYLEGDKEIDYTIPEEIKVDEEAVSDDLDFDLNLDNTNTRKITSFTFDDIDLE